MLLTGAGCGGGAKSDTDEGESREVLKDVDRDGLEKLAATLESASEEQRIALAASEFAAIADDERWDVGTCKDAWRALGAASKEQKQALVATAVDGCESMCPSEKSAKDDVLKVIGAVHSRQKTQALVNACDKEGKEPVFVGALESRRAQMDLVEFWILRSAFDETFRRLDARDDEEARELRGRFEELAQQLGRQLVLGLPPVDHELQVPESTAAKWPSLAPTVQVSQSAIGVDGVTVASVAPGGRVEGHERGSLIAPLHDALVPLAEQAVAERAALEARWGEKKKKDPTGTPDAGEGAKARGVEGKVGKKGGKLKRVGGTRVRMNKETTIMPPLVTEAARLGGRSLVVQCDRSLPYSLGYDVLYTAYQSGFAELRLGVWNEELGRQTIVDAHLGHWNPDWTNVTDDRPPLLLTILITADGFHVRGNAAILGGEEMGPPGGQADPTLAARDGVYPFEKLQTLMVKVKAEYPDEYYVVIAAEPGVSYEVLVGTADAAREHHPPGAERNEILFPYLLLAQKDDAVAFWKADLQRARGSKVQMSRETMDKQIAESAGILGDLNTTGDLNTIVESFGTPGGYGSGGGYFGRKSSATPGMSTGNPIILGALDKSVIDRVIKQHLAQIRYCYQKELKKDPSLSGKIVIKFTIAADGTVSSAETSSTTIDNATVEDCICQRFMRFKFPQPKGGGIVIVTYPFSFNSD